jgi:hypothetical protein
MAALFLFRSLNDIFIGLCGPTASVRPAESIYITPLL